MNNEISPEMKRRGIMLCFISGVLFSLGGICVKLIPWTALEINSARHGISMIIVGLYLLLTHHKIHINANILCGSVALAATHLLYTYATKLTTAGNAIVLEYTSPIFVILIMFLFFKQKPGKLDIITCIIVFAGIICFFIDSLSAGNMLGNFLGLAAGACYGSFFVINSRQKADPLVTLLLGNIICFAVGAPSLFKLNFAAQTNETWVAVLVLGVLQVAVANICLAIGLTTTPPVTANLLGCVEPVLNPAFVAIIYHEYLGNMAIAGFVIVLITVSVYNYKSINQGGSND